MNDGLGDFVQNTDEPSQEFINALTKDVWQFSAAKNYAQMKAISEQLVDAEGKLRTFKDFRFEAGKINQDFVGTWLQTEYNNAVASAQMGAKWQQIQRDKETLPYLQYETAGDERVRITHQELDHIIRSVDDDFWNTYYPPNGWNCRCTVRQLSYVKKETDLSKRTLPDVTKLFQENVGKRQKLFPPDHPYYDSLPKKVKEQAQEIRTQTENENTFVPASNIKEAEDFVLKMKLASDVNYRKLNEGELNIANSINRSLFESRNTGMKYDLVKVVNQEKQGGTLASNISNYDDVGNRDSVELSFNVGMKRKIERLTGIDFEAWIKQEYDKNYFVAENVKEVIDHEIGHNLVTQYATKAQHLADRAAQQFVHIPISVYGKSHGKEALAEIYALYLKSGKEALQPEWIDYFNKYSVFKIK